MARFVRSHTGLEIYWKLSGTETLANKPENKELGPSGEKHLEIFPTLSRRCPRSGVGVVYWAQHSSQLLATRSRESVMDELSAVFATCRTLWAPAERLSKNPPLRSLDRNHVFSTRDVSTKRVQKLVQ